MLHCQSKLNAFIAILLIGDLFFSLCSATRKSKDAFRNEDIAN
jgi:hypothetical protein